MLIRHSSSPLIAPVLDHGWESLVTTNPGAALDPATGRIHLVYRACGADDVRAVSRLGHAVSSDGIRFERHPDPVLSPDEAGYDSGMLEDPRLHFIEGDCWLTYATRPYPSGQYWLGDSRPWKWPRVPAHYPAQLRENSTSTGLALTRDFRSFQRLGRLTRPDLNDRDVYFLPELVNGRWWMIHRPMQWKGEGYPHAGSSMWICDSDDLLTWDYTRSRPLAHAVYDWESRKIGGNTPPIRTEHGWLTLHHGVAEDWQYRLGALLLDHDDPTRVIARSRTPLLVPELEWELKGCYSMGGVIFPCGKLVLGDELFVYYGAADKHIGLATCKLADLLAELLRNRV